MNRVLIEKDKPLLETAEEQLQSDKGFTLMEMLLCVLLSCIVISAIGNFMVAAIKQYNHVDREINLQIEAQTVVNQLGKMIKEADNVKYYTDGNDSYAVIYSKLEEALKTGDAATAKIKIVWFHANADANKPGAMYLFEMEGDASAYSNAIAKIGAGDTSNAAFMTNYVSGFAITHNDGTGTKLTSGLGKTENCVNIQVDLKNVFKEDKKEYTATDTIKLRNQVVQLP